MLIEKEVIEVDIQRDLWVPSKALRELDQYLNPDAKQKLVQILAVYGIPYWMPRSLAEIIPDLPEHMQPKFREILDTKKPLVYFAGPMQLDRDYDCWWRERDAPVFEAMGYFPLNTVVIECELFGLTYLEFQKKQRDYILQGRYRTFGEFFFPVMELDLALTFELRRQPKSCMVVYYPTRVVKTGTDIECYEAFRLGVATLVWFDGPRTKVRPFHQAPWAKMYREKLFRPFRTRKAMLAYAEERLKS